MYQVNHKEGSLRFLTLEELKDFLSKRFHEFEISTVTYHDGIDWILYKDFSGERPDCFHATQSCPPLEIVSGVVKLEQTPMGKYYQGEGDGFIWEKNGLCIAYSYGRTIRMIKGANKIGCKFKNKQIIIKWKNQNSYY